MLDVALNNIASSDEMELAVSEGEGTMNIKLGLERITRLLAKLGNPQTTVPIIHVAGTNGKGSVCAYLDSILRVSGLRVGRFTSPHLITVRDSIHIQGVTIPQDDYDAAKALVHKADSESSAQASPFELLTATAFQAFKDSRTLLDVAVVEVGMGGATDATNVCPKPLVTVVTAIDLDHQAFLGNTIEEIAAVKAGIIKKGTPCVVAPQAYSAVHEVVKDRANSVEAVVHTVSSPSRNAGLTHSGKIDIGGHSLTVQLPLPGAYQLDNAATAALTVDVLRRSANNKFAHITNAHIAQGISGTRWPGRLDWVDYKGQKILVDGAHNPASLQALREYLETLQSAPTTFIIAQSAPRDPQALLEVLVKDTNSHRVVATSFTTPEGMPWVQAVEPQKIAQAATGLGFTGGYRVQKNCRLRQLVLGR
ncbi:folylpolyglutamate synthase [Cystobasidiomycetes sp. EMM_F5]